MESCGVTKCVPDDEESDAPVVESGLACRKVSGVAIRALLDLVGELAVDGKVDLFDISRVAEAILGGSGPLSSVYHRTEQGCEAAFNRAAIERQRRDPFGRLIAEHVVGLLDSPPGIERRRLGQLFTAIRLMVGEEEHEELRARAILLAKTHRSGGIVDWEAFHADSDAKEIIEHVLVGICRSFKRFDARRDWFLVVLNASPSAVSLGSTSFTPLRPDERAKLAFTEGHMARLFDGLFATMRTDTFDSTRLRGFSKRWNATPDKVFGAFFLELARLHMQAK
jgi:hypothetical protein